MTFADNVKRGFFESLSRDLIDDIHKNCESYAFSDGQVICRRGDPGTSMFVITRGHVVVTLTNAEGQEYKVADLVSGDVFGEIALLTGEPRSANVRADGPLEVLEINQEDFARLIRVFPDFSSDLTRMLAGRIGLLNHTRELEHDQKEQLIANLLTHQENPWIEFYPGESRWSNELNIKIGRLRESKANLVITGEPGTGKKLTAQLVYSPEKGHLFSFNCSEPPPVIGSSLDLGNDESSNLVLSEAQRSALFGHEPGSAVYAKGLRRGYLELANHSTLVLENIQDLTRENQNDLVRYIQTGAFQRVGGGEDIPFFIRIVATGCENLAKIVSDGQFNPDLWELLSTESIELKPLRKRKSDIPVSAELLLLRWSKKNKSGPKTLSKNAMHSLVDYNWPMNLDELSQVIERAATISTGTMIEEKHIFLDISPFSSTGKLNLLRFENVASLVHNPLFPAGLKLLTLPVMLFLVAYTFLGPEHKNFANAIIWGIWWPLLILATIFGSRIWCGICPIPDIGKVFRLPFRKRLDPPGFLKKHGIWFSIAGFVIIYWSEFCFKMIEHPRATGILLSTVIGLACLTGLIFDRRTWCRFLCPLGRLLAQFSSISALELRSNSNVCMSQCTTHDCIANNQCPMNIHPSSSVNNHDCILCFSCLRACSHKSVHLDIRPPWYEVYAKSNWTLGKTTFSILLMSALMATRLTSSAETLALNNKWDSISFFLSAHPGRIILFLFFLSATPLMLLAVSSIGKEVNPREILSKVAYSYLPLTVAGLFGGFVRSFVKVGPVIMPGIASFLGLGEVIPQKWLIWDLGSVPYLYPLFTLAGGIFSLFLINLTGREYNLPDVSVKVHRISIIVMIILFLLIL